MKRSFPSKKMANLYLLNYNNYYNRIVKKELSILYYKKYQIGNVFTDINFIPGDGVDTTIILNWSNDSLLPNYLLVTENADKIVSRWFVIEAVRIRKGQYKFTLHRDLIADYYDKIDTAPCFIEKASINNIDDPAIFNNEDMTFNQIKQAEYQLKDKTKISWIVGYIPRDSFTYDKWTGSGAPTEKELKELQEANEKKYTVKTSTNYSGTYNESVAKLSDYTYYKYSKGERFTGKAVTTKYRIQTSHTDMFAVPNLAQEVAVTDNFVISMNQNGEYTGISGVRRIRSESQIYPYKYIGDDARIIFNGDNPDIVTIDGQGVFKNFTPEIMGEMNNYIPSYMNTATPVAFDDFIAQDNKILYNEQDNQYYKVKVEQVGTYTYTKNMAPGDAIYNLLYTNINKSRFNGTPNDETFQVRVQVYQYIITINLLSGQTSAIMPDVSKRYHLQDAPYDMFCIPYSTNANDPFTVYKNESVYLDHINYQAGLDLALSIPSILGSANLYDLQLLPYCPIQSVIKDNAEIDVGDTFVTPILVETLDSAGQLKSSVESIIL